MGYMRHHAIVVTGFDIDGTKTARQGAVELAAKFDNPCAISELSEKATNGYRSFLIAPDGSKEGWVESKQGEEFRAAVIEYFQSQDGLYISWCLVQFGDEAGDQKMISAS